MGKYNKYTNCLVCCRRIRMDHLPKHKCKDKMSACVVPNCTHHVDEHSLRWHIKKYHPEF